MKKLLLGLTFISSLAIAQPPVRFAQGATAPSGGACVAAATGSLYLRFDNPATNPSQVYVCTQTGASTYAWQFISHKSGSSFPSKCDIGEVFFSTGASAGQNWYGCTSADTWSLLGGVGTGNAAGYTTVTNSTTPVFTAASNTSTSFLLNLTVVVGNVTSSTLVSASTGQLLTFKICQPSAGGITFVAPTNVLNMGTIDTTANACSIQTFVYDGTNAQALGIMFVTGVNGGAITLPGSTSGSTVLQPAAIASGTLTLPAATDTLIAKATTDVLTNKTYDTAGAGNSFLINGVSITGTSGSGSTVCLSSGSICNGGGGSGTSFSPVAAMFTDGRVVASVSSALNFGSIANAACAQLTFTLPGADPDDTVAYKRPPGLAVSMTMDAWVSAYDTITIQVCNFTGSPVDPANMSYGVSLIR